MIQAVFDRTLFGRSYSPDDIAEMIEKNKAQMWVLFRNSEMIFVGVTRVINFPKRRLLDITCAAGELDEGSRRGMWAVLEAYAKDYDCSSIRAGGRKGWLRVLKDQFKDKQVEQETTWEVEI